MDQYNSEISSLIEGTVTLPLPFIFANGSLCPYQGQVTFSAQLLKERMHVHSGLAKHLR